MVGNAKLLCKTHGPEDPQWHEAHVGRIGGSRIANILGVGRQSLMRTYLDMLGESDPVEENEAMYWGNVLEPVVAKEFEKRNSMKVRNVNAVLCHPKYDRLIASVDRVIIGKKAPLEIKTTSDWMHRQWEGDEIPDDYEVQLRWYMMILGWKEGWLAALAGGQKYVQFHITRDKEIEDMMLERALDFIKLVDARTPPEVDGSLDCTKVLSKLYPEAERESIILSSSTGQRLYRLAEVETQAKLLKEEEERIKNEIRQEMGTAEAAYLPGTDAPAVTWKTTTTRRLDTAQFRKDYPTPAETYTKESTSRTLRVSYKGV